MRHVQIFNNHSRNAIIDDELRHIFDLKKITLSKYFAINLAFKMPREKKKKPKIPEAIGPYKINQFLGSGSFSVVHEAVDTRTNEKYAVKIVSRLIFKKREVLDHFEMEIRVLHQMRHPNIVQFVDILHDDSNIYVVMELCPNGDLFNYIIDHKFLSEQESKFLFKQVTLGLNYIHSIGGMHRDMKPENVLLDETGACKISDFGFARYAPFNTGKFGEEEEDEADQNSKNDERSLGLVTTPCGTASYASPECISGKPYDGQKSDMWSMGVILFAMLTGQLPWSSKEHAQLLQQIKNADFKIPTYLSDDAKDLISHLIILDPDKRLTTTDVLNHKWLLGADSITLSKPQPVGVSLKFLDKFFNKEVSNLNIKFRRKKAYSFLDDSSNLLKETKKKSENIRTLKSVPLRLQVSFSTNNLFSPTYQEPFKQSTQEPRKTRNAYDFIVRIVKPSEGNSSQLPILRPKHVVPSATEIVRNRKFYNAIKSATVLESKTRRSSSIGKNNPTVPPKPLKPFRKTSTIPRISK